MEKTIWLHVKTQGLYVIHDVGLREADLEPMFAYRKVGEDPCIPGGVTFYRPVREFLDGRFTQHRVLDQVVGSPANSVVLERQKREVDAFDGTPEHNVLKVGDRVMPLDGPHPCIDMRFPARISAIEAIEGLVGLRFNMDPHGLYPASIFRKCKTGETVDTRKGAAGAEEAQVAKTGRPALDADENRLKVGDFVQPVGTMKSEDRKKLPVGAGPYEIKRVVEDDFPKIFFDRGKGAVGWYPGVFVKTDAPYDTLE